MKNLTPYQQAEKLVKNNALIDIADLIEIQELIKFRINETIQEDSKGTWAVNKQMFKCLMDIQSLIK